MDETNILQGKRARKRAAFTAIRNQLSAKAAFHAELSEAAEHQKSRLNKSQLPPPPKY